MRDSIVVRGARTNNLQGVDLELPKGKLSVFCGVSGSGKTSMALDTLYAEGQRRYVESFSAYTRQFLEQLDKPDVDEIVGVPPAIAITQHNPSQSGRATVATVTEIADYVRPLFVAIGQLVCPDCGATVEHDRATRVAAVLVARFPGQRMMVTTCVSVDGDWSDVAEVSAEMLERGYLRAILGDRIHDLASSSSEEVASEGRLQVVIDRVTATPEAESRLVESIEAALAAGAGRCEVLVESTERIEPGLTINNRWWHMFRVANSLRCARCETELREPEVGLLDFNSPLGACPKCEGFGSVAQIDMDLVVPDPTKSIQQGAIAPWNTPAYAHELAELLALASRYDLPVDVPYAELNAAQHAMIRHGVPTEGFGGLDGFFEWLDKRKYKMHIRVFLSRWRSYRVCSTCSGQRFCQEALALRVSGKSLADFYAMQIRDARDWLDAISFNVTTQPLVGQLKARLDFLQAVGVGYLTLSRPLRTLSRGELQRVTMTTALSSDLVDMLYVLDEPTVGLHRSDTERLMVAVRSLSDRGNSVVVVEHEETFLRSADVLFEFGPRAGSEGGRIVFTGTPKEMIAEKSSGTGDWLSGRRRLAGDAAPRRKFTTTVAIRGATGNNLRGLDVEFPLGVLCAVSGVSGAGKSTLVRRTLFPAMLTHLKHTDLTGEDAPLPFTSLHGAHQVDEVVFVDAHGVSRSPRSNPVTYVKAFDLIRSVFAEQPEAQAAGLGAGHFSFNVAGGRCEACQGAGRKEVDMQFMADVTMTCNDCQGKRYRPEVLDIRYRGRNIAEVLDLTALDAFRFFRGQTKLQARLKSLLDVGLDYLPLGQPASSLSSGESQRLRLAGYLATKQSGRTLLVLDEPTSGLHFSDVAKLIDCFAALIEIGHSVLVVEHNLQLLLAADWIIDLGPEAGDAGGQLVAIGTPEQVAQAPQSATGQLLARYLPRNRNGG